MTYKEDCEFIRRLKQPITHYIYCSRSHAHWPDLGGVFGALALGELTPQERMVIICKYMAEGKHVVVCKNGPYDGIQPIYRAMKEGRIP